MSTMSLARAITKRVKRGTESASRSQTVKHPAISRNMISLPTELISTTNVQALTAPDIRCVSNSSSGSSTTSSSRDSDFSTIDRSFLHNLSDTSSIESSSSPITPSTPPMGEVKSFFESKPQYQAPITIASDVMPDVPDVPAIPQRAPSHSKRAHVELSRKRSMQRMTPPPHTIAEIKIRTSVDMFSSAPDPAHPFGRELAQVNEIAEEFGASTVLDEEEQEILSKGLCKFGVEDYLLEIAGDYGGVFEGQLGPLANPWV